ncbi:MAG: hypothetical protein IIC29_07830, partial [Chloroflexi bacterium]|nr:hypothetical protein [Chloroflexota bacterium]
MSIARGTPETSPGTRPGKRATAPASGASPLRQAWWRLRRKKIAMVTLTIIVFIYAVGIFAKPISTHSYSETDLFNTQEGPSRDHIFGTDRL